MSQSARERLGGSVELGLGFESGDWTSDPTSSQTLSQTYRLSFLIIK